MSNLHSFTYGTTSMSWLLRVGISCKCGHILLDKPAGKHQLWWDYTKIWGEYSQIVPFNLGVQSAVFYGHLKRKKNQRYLFPE